MLSGNKVIRDSVKAIVENAKPGLTVFSGRNVDRNISEYANVFISDGEFDSSIDGSSVKTSAELRVGYHKAGLPSDDDLDTVAEEIADAIEVNYISNTHPIIPGGFEYTKREDEFLGIYLIYSIMYRG